MLKKFEKEYMERYWQIQRAQGYDYFETEEKNRLKKKSSCLVI